MAQLCKLPCPVVRGATRLETNQAGRQVGDRFPQLRARYPLGQHGLAVPVHAVELKHVLCQVNTQCCNVHGDLSFFGWMIGCDKIIVAHLKAVYKEGGVHTIRVEETVRSNGFRTPGVPQRKEWPSLERVAGTPGPYRPSRATRRYRQSFRKSQAFG